MMTRFTFTPIRKAVTGHLIVQIVKPFPLVRHRVNNQNLINVAVSRAKDYVFFLVPDNITQGFPIRDVLGSLSGDEKNVLFCNKIEKVMFGQEDYIEKHTNVTCHMPVNVYYEPSSLYEVRKDDSAVDIQINEQFR